MHSKRPVQAQSLMPLAFAAAKASRVRGDTVR